MKLHANWSMWDLNFYLGYMQQLQPAISFQMALAFFFSSAVQPRTGLNFLSSDCQPLLILSYVFPFLHILLDGKHSFYFPLLYCYKKF